jgi:hypothetical protein
MSHIVTVKTEVRDAAAVRAACRRLSLAEPTQGEVQLFSGSARGLCVQLPDWQYPICCDLSTGQIKFDNFQGRWGDRKHLDAFLQAYAIEKVRLEARRRGHGVTERELADGSVKLTLQIEGGAA